MIDKISKDQEKKLVDSVVEAIRLSNDGLHPNDAIAKVAAAQEFNQDFIRRMSEAFNVSKSLKHLKSAKGDDRAAEFAIADPDVVIAELYPNAVAVPSEAKAAQWIPAGTDMSDERFFDIASTPVLSEKKSEVRTHGAPTLDQLVNRAYVHINTLERATGLAKQAMASAHSDLVESISNLASYFRQLDHEPFERVEKAALYHWGDSIKPLMSALYTMSKRASFGEKRASAAEKVCYRDRKPYELLAKAVDARDAYTTAAVKYASAKKAYATAKDKLDHRCRLITKIAEGDLDLSIPGILSPFKSLLELPTPQLSPSMIEETKAELLSPEYTAERSSIATQLALRDMLKHDPVLRAADPEAVIRAYNELARTAPSVVTSPMALKSYLRKGIEAETMDPIEIASLLKIEKGLGGRAMAGERE